MMCRGFDFERCSYNSELDWTFIPYYMPVYPAARTHRSRADLGSVKWETGIDWSELSNMYGSSSVDPKSIFKYNHQTPCVLMLVDA